MSDAKTPEQILLDTADLLEGEGWCQGNFFNEAGNRCVMGGIREAQDGDSHMGDMAIVLLHKRLDALGNKGMHVMDWNDEEGRTIDEVLALLRGKNP